MMEEPLAPNPKKPWLMNWEEEITGGVEVPPYGISESERTGIPPEDPYLKGVLNICECGHTGGDHRPYCIVAECSCERMKETKEWKIKKVELRTLLQLATMAGKKMERRLPDE